MNWYYESAGQQVGPVSDTELQSLVEAGTVKPETLVWREGLANWQPYGTVVSFSAPPPLAEAASGVPTPPASETKPVPAKMVYAGFWIRVVACLVDFLILSAVGFGIGIVVGFILRPSPPQAGNMRPFLIMQGMLLAIHVVISMAYEVGFVVRCGATPGKLACRIKVVTADGGAVGYGCAFGRYFANILSKLTLGIGYVMAAFDDQKRTLHDRLCNTRVIKIP